jgi:hypothetical protein
VKPELFEIELEDNQQLDTKCSIDEMMASKSLLSYFVATIDGLQENVDTLELRKKELKQKLAVKVSRLARDILLAEIEYLSDPTT